MTQMVRTTMRSPPDRIIMGEVRGAEVLAPLKAWKYRPLRRGHQHPRQLHAALIRLSSLVQEAGVPPQPHLIAATINLIVFIVRAPTGRRVTEFFRVAGYHPSKGFMLTPIQPDP